MKFIKALLFAFGAATLLLFSASAAVAQPSIPKDQIPSDLAPEVRTEIERLYSENHEAGLTGRSTCQNGFESLPLHSLSDLSSRRAGGRFAELTAAAMSTRAIPTARAWKR